MGFFTRKKNKSTVPVESPDEVDDSYVMAESQTLPETPPASTTTEGIMVVEEKSTPKEEQHDQEEPTTTTRATTHLCFNRLCDMRVGTISIHAVNIFVRTLAMVFSFAWGAWFPISTDLLSIVLSAIAVCGAINYEYLATGLATLGLFLVTLFHIFYRSSVFGIAFDALLLYPTAMITFEIYKGVMAKDNYEEYIDPEIRAVSDEVKGGIVVMQERFPVLDFGGNKADEDTASDGSETDYVNIESAGAPTSDTEKPIGSLA